MSDNDFLKCIGILTLVNHPVDELDETGLSDTRVVGACHAMNKESANRQLLAMVDDYLDDHGPIQDGQELRMDFTTWIRYS